LTLDELVTKLRDSDVRIFDDDHAFKLQAPKGVLTPQLLEIITSYSADLLYLVRLGDVRVCPARWEHRPQWRYSPAAHAFVCRACRHEEAS
jgi:TubC N-terminal docking domain